MSESRIVLVGLGAKVQGLRWESDRSFRIGRNANAEVVLGDTSVDRLHAEIKYCGAKWMVRDLAANVHYPTLLNGVALAGGQRELRLQDVLQIGRILIRVEALALAELPEEAPAMRYVPGVTPVVPVVNSPPNALLSDLRIHARAHRSWDEAFAMIATQCKPQQSVVLRSLLQANRQLSPLSKLEDVLHSTLENMLSALGAQRGAILLVEPNTNQLELKAQLGPRVAPNGKGYSRTLAERCFRSGESLLCQDVHADAAMLDARSVRFDLMSSVLCVLLRTPRQRLGVLHLDRGPLQEPFTEADLLLADALAASMAAGIECAQTIGRQQDELMQTVNTLARAGDLRDRLPGAPAKRVADYALFLADELRLPDEDRPQLQMGALVYDIGKIGVDECILRKPGRLTPVELAAMQSHTVKGAALLETTAALQRLVPIVRSHHERWDGSGYPDRLGHEQIALPARIIAVADAFDAMTSPRPYRPALSHEAAYREIVSLAGSQFDPTCVQAFLRARNKIEGSVT